ncbi:hypothetical protein C0585_05500 [Candidatus Woesearchaeota archaeon]|nr:MAG: hypothetical protein C0585_05500 [Candidatus Woesearchaeota archaeon]
MRTGNPTLNKNSFNQFQDQSFSEVMTLDGTVNKTFLMLLILIIPAFYTWNSVNSIIESGMVQIYMFGSLIAGLILALMTVFKKNWSPITAPLYAFAEGIFLGLISVFMEMVYPGIVFQAIALTFGTLFLLLFLYKSRIIKATENFKLGVVSATGAIALIYIASIVLSFFGINIPFIHESGLIGIGFSLFVVVIAALNLVLDFDFIENASGKAPKYMEWYGAFGLMVTLIWLYIEILRLLAKLRDR